MEGVRLATIDKRIFGAFIDWLLLSVPVVAVMLALSIVTQKEIKSLSSILFVCLQLAYEGFMYATRNGQTFGKIVMNTRVVRPDGSRISAGQAWARAAAKIVLGCLFFVDYIPAFLTADRATIHDMITRTRVMEIVRA
ncbi:MAG TPA: RDD family protein [Thermoanaerobaculia bacterium]|nr:RDD family protein [Thermoanaerobaculia bacterium]